MRSGFLSSREWAMVEMVRGMRKHKVRMLISAVITILAMAFPLVFYTLANGLYEPMQSVSIAQEMTIFTEKTISIEELSKLQETVASQPGLVAVRTVTPEEALQQIGGNSTVSVEVSENPLPDIILATVDTSLSLEGLKAAADAIEKTKGIDSVVYDPDWNRNLATVKDAFTRFSLLSGGLLLALILMALLGNASLNVTTDPRAARRLRLLGANSLFISRPDAWRGGFIFLISALAALAASNYAVLGMTPALQRAFDLYHLPISFEPLPLAWQCWFTAGAAILGGTLSGISSLVVCRRSG